MTGDLPPGLVHFPPLPPLPEPRRVGDDPRQRTMQRVTANLSRLLADEMRLQTANTTTGFFASAVDLGRLKTALEDGLQRFDIDTIRARWEVDVRDWIADLVARKSPIKVVFNVSQVSLSLGLGALVLHMSGLSGPSLTRGDISFLQSLGMILSGFVVLFTSAMLLFVVMALSRGISVWVPIKEGWLTSVSADGALLAIAPIFVVAVDYSLLLLPMLGVTSFIVFTSARQAMRQAHAASHDDSQCEPKDHFHQIREMVAIDKLRVALFRQQVSKKKTFVVLGRLPHNAKNSTGHAGKDQNPD